MLILDYNLMKVKNFLHYFRKKEWRDPMLYDEILILCGKSGISIAKLERETNLGNGTIRRWKQANPGAANLKKVADYFGVTLDELLFQTENSKNCVQ